jgi:hypothetical protein
LILPKRSFDGSPSEPAGCCAAAALIRVKRQSPDIAREEHVTSLFPFDESRGILIASLDMEVESDVGMGRCAQGDNLS